MKTRGVVKMGVVVEWSCEVSESEAEAEACRRVVIARNGENFGRTQAETIFNSS